MILQPQGGALGVNPITWRLAILLCRLDRSLFETFSDHKKEFWPQVTQIDFLSTTLDAVLSAKFGRGFLFVEE